MNIPKMFFKKILYATDLSIGGCSAFAYAARLCRRYGADPEYQCW